LTFPCPAALTWTLRDASLRFILLVGGDPAYSFEMVVGWVGPHVGSALLLLWTADPTTQRWRRGSNPSAGIEFFSADHRRRAHRAPDRQRTRLTRNQAFSENK
jgi:hypothetical protein